MKEKLTCSYCGDTKTEWDHLHALIRDCKPTGFITEIANLVPACGKCNQSKGNTFWKDWIRSSAKKSPTSRNIPDIEARIARLEDYGSWRKPRKIDFREMMGLDLWKDHKRNLDRVLELLKESQTLANQLKPVAKSSIAV